MLQCGTPFALSVAAASIIFGTHAKDTKQMIRKSEVKKTKRTRARLRLIGLAVTVCLVAGIVISDNTHATSSSPQKYSKNVPNNTNFVDVIIQPAGSWSSSLETDIKSKGRSVK